MAAMALVEYYADIRLVKVRENRRKFHLIWQAAEVELGSFTSADSETANVVTGPRELSDHMFYVIVY